VIGGLLRQILRELRADMATDNAAGKPRGRAAGRSGGGDAAPVLVCVIGFADQDLAGVPLPDGSRVFDLDRVDPGESGDSTGAGDVAFGAVVLAARTATDLRRAAALAALLPPAARMVVAVAESPPHRPLALPAVTPQWRRLRDLRARRRSTGQWWLQARFSTPMPVADFVAATVRGLDGGRAVPPAAPAPVVALAGSGAADWRPGDAAAVPVPVAGPLGGETGLPPADIVLRAAEAGAPDWSDPTVAAVDRPAMGRVSWARLGRGGAAGRADALSIVPMLADPHAVPPVDERSVNPLGFVAAPEGESAALVQAGECLAVTVGGPCGGGGRPAGTPVPGPPGSGGSPAGTEVLRLPPGGGVTDADVARLRGLRAIRVEWGRHSGPLAAVRAVAGLAAAGVPVFASRVPGWARALGADLTEALCAADEAELADELRREEHSVRLRRAALRTHSTRARWAGLAAAAGLAPPEPPRVSVLLCTRRPDYLAAALGQIARQRGVDLEVILTLHGVPADLPAVRTALAGAARTDAAGGAGLPITVVEMPAELPFGTALNRGASRASGRYLAKWDDDDWYGPEHLADMLMALSYSGADLVGALSQLVYLEQIDRTVLRPGGPSERFSAYVSGGSLVMERSVLDGVGGFRPLRRHVDSGLLRAVAGAGGRIYRTHGLGYLLHRRADGHTWTRPVTHFLRRSTRQWKGFRPGALLELDQPAERAR